MARKFGVEVEFAGDMTLALDALRATGLQIHDSRHTHVSGRAPNGWTVKRDGSVSRGGELVSPPLDFDDPEQRGQVNIAVEALQAAGCTTDTAAGIHVHIEATNEDGTTFSAKQIGAVVRFFYKFEDAIYRIASSGWESLRPGARTYAVPIPEITAQKIMKVRTSEELERVWNGRAENDPYGYSYGEQRRRRSQQINHHHDRYHAVNLQSFFYRNTVEFRMFNSSLNPKRIQAYIALCMAIMEDARQGHSRSVKKSYRLGAMHSGQVSEQALMMRLQQVLRSEGKDTHVLMSEEDWKNLRKVCWKGSRPQPNIFAGQQTRIGVGTY